MAHPVQAVRSVCTALPSSSLSVTVCSTSLSSGISMSHLAATIGDVPWPLRHCCCFNSFSDFFIWYAFRQTCAVMEVHGTKDSRRRHQSMYLVAIEHQLHPIPVVQCNRVWDTASPQCKRWMERHHLRSLSQYSSWGALIRFRETRTLIDLFFPSLCLHGGKSGNPPQASHNISYSVKLQTQQH